MKISFFEFFTRKSIYIFLKATFILIIQSGLSIGVQIIVLIKEKNFVIFFRKGPLFGQNLPTFFFFKYIIISIPIDSPD